jgi:hypothetical protein
MRSTCSFHDCRLCSFDGINQKLNIIFVILIILRNNPYDGLPYSNSAPKVFNIAPAFNRHSAYSFSASAE